MNCEYSRVLPSFRMYMHSEVLCCFCISNFLPYFPKHKIQDNLYGLTLLLNNVCVLCYIRIDLNVSQSRWGVHCYDNTRWVIRKWNEIIYNIPQDVKCESFLTILFRKNLDPMRICVFVSIHVFSDYLKDKINDVKVQITKISFWWFGS